MEQITTERFHLDRFLEIFPDAPVGQPQKTTHPDFVIPTCGHVVGIELTQLYKIGQNYNFQPREIEAFREKIVSLAKDIYSSKNAAPLDVGVLFSEIALADAEVTARKLVAVIEELASGDEAWRVVTHDEIGMPEEFSIIRIIKRPLHVNYLWSVSYSGWLPDLDKSVIQTAISKKNEKIAQYRKYADELWLLLVMDQIYLSSSFQIPDSIIAHTYDSAFNKTILFSCIDKKWWSLKTTAPK
ncbi:MAG: hypothetical protein KGQ68_07865 [Gammaproteobacteria bacterium]|nr:hypothetical protein [Gammaproteobacteria bacterium]MDE2024010.1 hypothetical protein [Gammaproteobacteria bacterium]